MFKIKNIKINNKIEAHFQINMKHFKLVNKKHFTPIKQ